MRLMRPCNTSSLRSYCPAAKKWQPTVRVLLFLFITKLNWLTTATPSRVTHILSIACIYCKHSPNCAFTHPLQLWLTGAHTRGWVVSILPAEVTQVSREPITLSKMAI